MKINKTLKTALLALVGTATVSHAAVIAVMDGGSDTATSHSTIVDLSTGGDSIGGMTGTFTSSADDYHVSGPNYWNNTQFAFQKGGTAQTATWTFGNMTNGTQWDVYATWVGTSNRATDAPFTISGLATVDIDQEGTPAADLILSDDGGTSTNNFQKIGTATVSGGQITITVTDDANDWVIVDGIAIQQVPEPSSAALIGLGGFALILRRRK